MFLVVGSSTVDIFVKGIQDFPSQGVDDFNINNLTFTNQPTTINMGGNGANSAYVLAKFGMPTYLCSAIGKDHLGTQMTAWLKDVSVDLTALYISKTEATSVTTILFDENNTRLSFHHRGSSGTIRFEDIPEQVFGKCKFVLISGISLLTGLRENGYAQILRKAKENGALTALDIGPAVGIPAFVEELKPLIPNIDYLIANEFEAATATGESDIYIAARTFLDAGVKHVIIKQGGKGSIAVTREEIMESQAFQIDANVTVGAGDAFNAGFINALKLGMNLKTALTYGNATSALVLSSPDGILGAPIWREVESLVSKK